MRLAPWLLTFAGCGTEVASPGECADGRPLTELTVEVEGVPGPADVVLFAGDEPVARTPAEGMEVVLPLPADPAPASPGDLLVLALVDPEGVFLGAAAEWLVWSEGWNLVHSEMSAGMVPSAGCTTSIGTDLRPLPSIPFQGELPPDEAAGRRIALVSALAYEGEDVAEPTVADIPAVETWSLVGDGTPPDEHLADFHRAWGDEWGRDGRVAWELLVLYEDADGSGDWSTADEQVGIACAEDDWGTHVVGASWVPPALTPESAEIAEYLGLGTGWTTTADSYAAEYEVPANVGFRERCN